MIDSRKSYPAMKDSGVPWLAEVPRHWNVQRGKWLFRTGKETNCDQRNANVLSLTLRGVVNNDPNDPEGLVPKDYGTYQLFSKGDLVFKLIDLENLRTSRVGLVHEDGIMSPAYVRLIRAHEGQQRYFFLQYFDLYQRGIFNQLGAGVRSALGAADLLEVPVVVPPRDEQAAIVRFLDHADRRIRRYIRAKQKLIKLLEEQKQAIILRAVTRGLDPNVRLKSSGVEWLGDVPEHWTVASLRFRYEQCLGKMVDAKKAKGTRLLPYLRNVDVQWDRINTVNLPQIDITPEEQERFTVKAGDLLVCEGRHLGRAAIWRGELEVCAFQKALHRLRARDERTDSPRYLYYCLHAVHFQDAFGASSSDNSIPHLTGEMLRAFRFPFPPAGAQAAIARYLDECCRVHGEAKVAFERQIQQVREYRTRLIADVVIGKLDVREAAAKLPQEAELPEPLDETEVDGDAEEGDAGDVDGVSEESEA